MVMRRRAMQLAAWTLLVACLACIQMPGSPVAARVAFFWSPSDTHSQDQVRDDQTAKSEREISRTETLAGSSRGRLTDMTALARQFGPHSGPTMLYVNFDGWRN